MAWSCISITRIVGNVFLIAVGGVLAVLIRHRQESLYNELYLWAEENDFYPNS